MEAATILSADVLDIIFDERNKEYGAYDLRKHYQRRLTKAFLLILLLVVLLCLAYVLFGSMKPGKIIDLQGPDITLDPLTKEPKPEVIKPPKLPELPKVKTIQFTVPLIVHTDPPPEEMPPVTDEIDKSKIGTVNIKGEENGDIVEAPVDAGKAIVDAPKKQEEDVIFRSVEIESQYPGGMAEWGRFLYKNFIYPQEAIDNEKQGTVLVQFVVDAEGSVTDVTAISGPEELRAPAIAMIKKSGKWTPGIQNGKKVKSYKRQPITFKLAEG